MAINHFYFLDFYSIITVTEIVRVHSNVYNSRTSNSFFPHEKCNVLFSMNILLNVTNNL